jgi:hypothetical protein
VQSVKNAKEIENRMTAIDTASLPSVKKEPLPCCFQDVLGKPLIPRHKSFVKPQAQIEQARQLTKKEQ